MARNPVSFNVILLCVMSEKTYQLYAWTEREEVRFSELALWEQEMLLMDEYDSSYYSEDLSWERYERLSHIAWQWGMLLLGEKDYRSAYNRFSDGIDVCVDALRKLPFPKDGGVNPFILALDDLYKGCEEAAYKGDGMLWELFCEDAIRDIRHGYWASAPTRTTSP